MSQQPDASVTLSESTFALVVVRRGGGGTRQLRLTREHLVLAAATCVAVAAWVGFGVARLGAAAGKAEQGATGVVEPGGASEAGYARIEDTQIVVRGDAAELALRVTAVARGEGATARLWGIAEWTSPEATVRRVASASGIALDRAGQVIDGKAGERIVAGVATPARMSFSSPGEEWTISAIRVGLSREDGSGSFDVARVVPDTPMP